MTAAAKTETRGFETEVNQLLDLMIHSLYSNKEIFLRELISNASDACDRLRFSALSDGSLYEEDIELKIKIGYDAEQRTITVSDNGIGMTRDEVIDHIGTIAKSGTRSFLDSMTGDEKNDAKLIGQFGVGFYSSFIVADEVTLRTRKAGEAADQAVEWVSQGKGEYKIGTTDKQSRGTEITLRLREGEDELLNDWKLRSIITSYSDHIDFPVVMDKTIEAEAEDGETVIEEETVNQASALWTRARSEIKDDEYREFYKHVAHDFEDPLDWSHNRVEGKREYTSLLYIPAAAPFDLWNRDAPRGLKLYVQRVFIMDDAEQFLPLYLRFVKGVVDSSDLPLNVSRELLQQNPELGAMRSALTRRVLDMLNKTAGSDEETYLLFWREFGQVLKEGVVEDQANKDKIAKLLRFASTHNDGDSQDQSLQDYLKRAADDQNRIYYILAENYATAVASPHLEQLKDRGIEVLLLTDRIDPWLVDGLAEFDGKMLVDVARSGLELPEDDGPADQETINEEHKSLLDKIKVVLDDRVAAVNVSRRLVESPACVVTADTDLNPQLKRVLEASGQVIPESKPILEINVKHPLVNRLSGETDEGRFDDLSHIVLDHALLAEGSQLDNPADYVQRMNKLLLDIDAGELGE